MFLGAVHDRPGAFVFSDADVLQVDAGDADAPVLMHVPVDQIIIGTARFHSDLPERQRIGRRIVSFFGKRFAHGFLSLVGDFFARIPAHLPLDAVFIVYRDKGARRALVRAGRHGVTGHDELIDAPETFAAAQRALGAIGETAFTLEHLDVFGGLAHA